MSLKYKEIERRNSEKMPTSTSNSERTEELFTSRFYSGLIESNALFFGNGFIIQKMFNLSSVKLGIQQMWVFGEPASSGCLRNCSSLADILMCCLNFSA